jgi:cytidylate kinase
MKDTKEIVTQEVHKLADRHKWTHLSIDARRKLYEEWTNDPKIGGALSQVMDANRVRVYLKDTVMRSYARSQRPELVNLLNALSISCGYVTKKYSKPSGILCDGLSLYTLAVAKEWKTALMSAFERASEEGKVKHNTVFFSEHTAGHFVDASYRAMIGAAARRLSIEIVWLT